MAISRAFQAVWKREIQLDAGWDNGIAPKASETGPTRQHGQNEKMMATVAISFNSGLMLKPKRTGWTP